MTARQRAYEEARTKTTDNLIRVLQASDAGFPAYEAGHIDALIQRVRMLGADLDEMREENERLEEENNRLRPMQPPQDENHALLCGAVMMGTHLAQEAGLPYTVSVLDDEKGVHLATFRVQAPSGGYLVTIAKEDAV